MFDLQKMKDEAMSCAVGSAEEDLSPLGWGGSLSV